MQIFNSLTSFFTSKDDSPKNEFISESSTKTNFKDYLHGAMDEVSNGKTETEPQKPEILNLTSFDAKTVSLENIPNTKLESNFKFELAKLSETPSKEEIILGKFIDEPNQISTELKLTSNEENLVDDEEAIDESSELNEENVEADEISNLEIKDKNENFIELDPDILETDENLEIESSNLTPISNKENRINQDNFSNEFEQNNLNEVETNQFQKLENTVLIPIEPENKKNIPDQKIELQEKPVSKIDSQVFTEKTRPEIIKEETPKQEVKQTSFELLKQNFESLKEAKLEPEKEKIVSEFLPKELKKEKKEKDSLTKLELKEEKESHSKIESIKSELKHSKDFSEEQSLDKSKWQISKKEHISLEAKKENLFVIKENLTNQIKSEEKSVLTTPIKQDLDSKLVDKQKEMKPEKESFQKSLNELVQKAKLNIVENGKNTAQISLYPNELGKITLNIDVTKEKVEGKILVDNETVKSLLMNDFLLLKEDLKQSGLNLSSLSVEVKTNEEQLASFFNFEKKETLEKSEEFFENKKSKSEILDSENDLELHESDLVSVSKKLVDVRV